MITVDAHRTAPDAAPADHPAQEDLDFGETSLLTDVGRRIAEALPAHVAAACRALDVGVLGHPGRDHRVRIDTADASVVTEAATATAADGSRADDAATDAAGVAVRLYAGSLVIAATPGAPGPCPTCLDRRWIVCRPIEERRVLDEPHGIRTTATSPPTAHAVTIAAQLVGAAVTGEPDGASYPVWAVDTQNAEVNRFGLLRDSSCPHCATPTPDTAEDAEIVLRRTPASAPGATRARRPDDLALPMDALANPVCGMLGAAGMRAYHATATAPVSGRFHVRSKYGLHEMWWSGHAESYHLSDVLGVLEGLERDAGQQPRRVQLARRARVTDLDVPFVEMETCGLYSADFYQRHQEKYVPWTDNPEVPWVWGWSLRDRRSLLVPEQIVYYLDHRTDHRNTVQECSNGCASGSSVTEAVLHGLLELIERDAFLISWYSGLTPREIDLDTVNHPLVRQMRAQVDLLGFDLRCFDVRADLPVPAVGAVAVRRDGGPGTLCFAGGASLDPADAVRAAVCEVASYVPGFDERVTDSREHLELMIDDYRHVTELSHHALLFGMPQMRPHAEHWLRQSEKSGIDEVYADWTQGRAPVTDLREPVEEIVGLLADRGYDTVVVDQSTPEQEALGLHTVATLVPGLIPIDFGWERQRVLTMPRMRWAPYRAGLTPRPLTADQLHRVPHPFP
ncbi:TOMM precursor leader peptide-binding protein [Phytoactinopolyspora halotolerans]|uniref:TOMM leader peptide-binding protein n=1 Tax=Phytoactinopolyspora halotolerans TaxID=1981512 RepID=A0A6L9SF48_9ACTN|nr:TOMM precursor leader peptide-binding protein [Phytoactinopolyspora halotolerans]NEE03719.1 TOMM precursor leader peptide-binding protein [Phytoactinopolyspora halotolerans]